LPESIMAWALSLVVTSFFLPTTDPSEFYFS